MANSKTLEQKEKVVLKVMHRAKTKGIPQKLAAEELGYPWTTIANWKQMLKQHGSPLDASPTPKARKIAVKPLQPLMLPEMDVVEAVILTGSPKAVSETLRGMM